MMGRNIEVMDNEIERKGNKVTFAPDKIGNQK